MIYEIRFTEKAENDIEQIYSYISTEYQSENTAKSIVSGILNSIETLNTFPFRCSPFRLNERYRVLFYKSYNIVYEVSESKVIVNSVIPSVLIN